MKKQHSIRYALFALVLTMAAQTARADDKEILPARVYKVGDVTRYKLTINFNASGMEGTITETSKSTVKEIKKNGDAVLLTTVEGGHLTVSGQEQEITELPPVTEVRSKLNRLVDLKMGDTPGNPFSPEVLRLMLATNDLLYPEKAVKTGGTWQTELDNPIVKGKKVVVKATFVGTEKVEKDDLWKIKQSCEADTGPDGGKMTFEATFWLKPANGQVVKMEGKVNDIPSQFGTMSWTMKMALAPVVPD